MLCQDFRKCVSKGFSMTGSEEDRCARIRESIEDTDKRRKGATVKASKM